MFPELVQYLPRAGTWGGVQMGYRILMKKLNFIQHLDNLDDSSLAKQIYDVQKNQFLPGLVQECSDWIVKLKLPNIFKRKISKPLWKKW